MFLKSAAKASRWPAVMHGRAAELMALQHQMEASQWWTPDDLRTAQFSQLTLLAEHAVKTVPYYARLLWDAGFRIGADMDAATWSRLPILTRQTVNAEGSNLFAEPLPPELLPFRMAHSSGSTGVPVGVRKTPLDGLFWGAAAVREKLWHTQDFQGRFATIRAFSGMSFEPAAETRLKSAQGLIQPDWGRPVSLIWNTGQSGLLHSSVPIEGKARFLQDFQPQYLSTSPSTLRLLAAYFRDNGLKLPSLRHVETSSERLDDDLRALCQQVFGCPVVHNYSANEVGYIALQCPHAPVFHVQAESIYCEVVDADGRPCAPGQIGRVLVTPLHGFAMPLLRYEIGDEAEPGAPCACGRGLPVLTNIVGRLSDYLTLKSGGRRRVTYNNYRLSTVTGILEYQIAQKSLDEIELRLVLARALTDAESRIVDDVMNAAFGDVFRIRIIAVDALPRTAAGKLRSFVSEIG